MSRHTAHVSRIGLVIIGLILLLGAGAVLARGLNASRSVLGNPNGGLLTHSQVQYPTQHGWVWPVVAAVCALIAVLALLWMAAQTSTKTVRNLPLEPERLHGTTTMPATAVTGAVTDELESYPTIRAANAVLRGSATRPNLDLAVTQENRADPATVRESIETEALPHMRTALEMETIPTVLRLSFSRAFDRHLA